MYSNRSPNVLNSTAVPSSNGAVMAVISSDGMPKNDHLDPGRLDGDSKLAHSAFECITGTPVHPPVVRTMLVCNAITNRCGARRRVQWGCFAGVEERRPLDNGCRLVEKEMRCSGEMVQLNGPSLHPRRCTRRRLAAKMGRRPA